MRRQISTVVFASLLFTSSASYAQAIGHVRGAVVVWSEGGDALVPAFELVFVSDTVRKSVITNAKGDYEVDLPRGRYSVSSHEAGFYSVQRAPFEVKPNATVMINLAAMVQPITIYNLGRQELDLVEKPDDPLKTELLRDTRAMIRFAERTESVTSTEYRGTVFQSGNERLRIVPVLTRDILTIYADRLVVETDSQKVRALGNVVVEDGKQRRLGKEATVELGANDPIATIKIQGR